MSNDTKQLVIDDGGGSVIYSRSQTNSTPSESDPQKVSVTLERLLNENNLIELNNSHFCCSSKLDCILIPRSREMLRLLLELHFAGILCLDEAKIDLKYIPDLSMLFSKFNQTVGTSIDISNWEISEVESMALMFYECDVEVTGWENWKRNKLRNVRNMRWMTSDAHIADHFMNYCNEQFIDKEEILY